MLRECVRHEYKQVQSFAPCVCFSEECGFVGIRIHRSSFETTRLC